MVAEGQGVSGVQLRSACFEGDDAVVLQEQLRPHATGFGHTQGLEDTVPRDDDGGDEVGGACFLVGSQGLRCVGGSGEVGPECGAHALDCLRGHVHRAPKAVHVVGSDPHGLGQGGQGLELSVGAYTVGQAHARS